MGDSTEGKSLFKRFINTIIGAPDNPTSEEIEEVGPYAPQKEVPVDEKFAKNYTRNGGHFIYITCLEDAVESLKNIIQELSISKLYCHDNQLIELLRVAGLSSVIYEKYREADVFFSTSEFLIAHNGSIMMTSNQFKGLKQVDLPNQYVIIGRTSKIVNKLSDGMAGIKDIYKGDHPTQITTLNGLESDCSSSNDSKGTKKTIFLLLLEDA